MRPLTWLFGAALAAAACGETPATQPATPHVSNHTVASLAAAASVIVAPPDFEALPGAEAHFGVVDGAGYRIEVPRDWNGELLLWAKGFRGYGAEVAVETPPPALRSALIERGYAWAASSYSAAGWVPGAGTEDTLALKRLFEKEVGTPVRTFIGGESMGGNIVVLSLENHADEYDGGLATCGVVAGTEWFDYLLAWGMVAEVVAGYLLPLDEGPDQVALAVEAQVLPALGAVETPTRRGQAFASVIRNLTGGPRPFFDEGFRAAYPGNFGLITGDPGRVMPETRAGTTTGMDFRADAGLGFDGDAINRSIRHFEADGALRDGTKHPELAPTTGNLQDPLLTLHETGDLTVPVSMEQSYRRKVDALGKGNLLVQRLIRGGGHCQFSDAELVTAWNDLTAWVESGQAPPGDSVLGDLSDAGLPFTNPLREKDPALR